GRIERGAADAGDAPDLVDDVADEEVAEADLVDRAVCRDKRDDLERRGRCLLDQDALLAYLGGEARLDALPAGLNLDAGIAGIGARLEVGDDLDDAEGVRRRFIAQDIRRTVEFVLDEASRARVEVLDRGTGELGRQRDRGRRDDRILRNRQLRDGE